MSANQLWECVCRWWIKKCRFSVTSSDLRSQMLNKIQLLLTSKWGVKTISENILKFCTSLGNVTMVFDRALNAEVKSLQLHFNNHSKSKVNATAINNRTLSVYVIYLFAYRTIRLTARRYTPSHGTLMDVDWHPEVSINPYALFPSQTTGLVKTTPTGDTYCLVLRSTSSTS